MRAAFQPLLDAGATAAHVAHVERLWLQGRDIVREASRRGLTFPRSAAAALEAVSRELERIATVHSEHPAADGSVRLLLRLDRGGSAECVLLPGATLCLSTQIGCAVGCGFCMTGRGGLERQLTTEEILAQLVLARRRRPIRRVVLMGMGEPGHNLGAVLPAIEALGRAGAVGHKEIVFSTVGAPEWFERLAAGTVKPALALSLHTTDRALRERLLPRAPRHDPAALFAAATDYSVASAHPLQLQWTLLAGINDGDEELDRLIALVGERRVVVNFIPWNPIEGGEFRSTAPARAHEMTRRLHRAGIVAKLRRSAAPEVDGACGQLRSRLVAPV